jgi:hypothetical protein
MTIMIKLRRKAIIEETINIAKAKKHFSELLGQVAFGKKHILVNLTNNDSYHIVFL